MTGRKLEYWVIPPKADAEFVASMEAALDTYATPYDPRHPVVCMDEQRRNCWRRGVCRRGPTGRTVSSPTG